MLLRHVLSKLTGRLTHSVLLKTGTFFILLTEPLKQSTIKGTINIYFTQPYYISLQKALKSQIRVFLRCRSFLLRSALKSPNLQVIRRTLKSVATNTVFSVSTHSRTNCQIRRTKHVHRYKTSLHQRLNIIILLGQLEQTYSSLDYTHAQNAEP